MFGRVRDREVRVCGAGLLEEFADAAMKLQHGRARLARSDLDVLPRDAAGPARLQGLERRFLGGETRGIMLCGDRPAPVAVGTLARSENALDETRRAEQDFAHATDFDDVYAD